MSDSIPPTDAIDEILDAFYYDDVDFTTDDDQWSSEDDVEEILEASSVTSSVEHHSETDEETNLLYDLYGDSMSESSSVVSGAPDPTRKRETDSIDASQPSQSTDAHAHIDFCEGYSPEREDFAFAEGSGRSGASSLSCLEAYTSASFPRPTKMASRLSTDTIKMRSRDVVLT